MAYQRVLVVSVLVSGLVFQFEASTVNLQGTFSCKGNTTYSVATSSTVSPVGDISSIFTFMMEYYAVSRIFCGLICKEENFCDAMTYDETTQVCELYFWNGQNFAVENFLNNYKYCWKPQVLEMTSSTTSLATTTATLSTALLTTTLTTLLATSPTTQLTTSATSLSTSLSTTTKISATTASSLIGTSSPMPLGISNCRYGSSLTSYVRNSISCPRLLNCTCDKGVPSYPQTSITSADDCFTCCSNDINCLGFSYYTDFCYIATLSTDLDLITSIDEFACLCQK